jgi:hypothetical protein
MALKLAGSFAAGVAVGWVARSTVGSTREALVRVLVVTDGLRERARRIVAEQIEFIQDLFAEGRARCDEQRAPVSVNEGVPPRVVGTPTQGRAA